MSDARQYPAVSKRKPFVSVIRWIISARVASIIARAVVIVGLVWAALGFVDRFKLVELPDGWTGAVLFVLLSAVCLLGVELILVHVRADSAEADTRRSPQQDLAEAILEYATVLSRGGLHGDRAVLELRGWASRTLHLIGANQQRQELGQLALAAAAAVGDDVTQAEILVDDLGWAVYEAGDETAAISNIEEALAIASGLDDAVPGDIRIAILVKARRHLLNIRAPFLKLEDSREQFSEIRRECEEFVGESARELNRAQLDHSEALVILSWLENQFGEAAQLEAESHGGKLLENAIQLAWEAEQGFERLGDLERVSKALRVRVGALAHRRQKRGFRAASAKLQRVELEVARTAR